MKEVFLRSLDGGEENAGGPGPEAEKEETTTETEKEETTTETEEAGESTEENEGGGDD